MTDKHIIDKRSGKTAHLPDNGASPLDVDLLAEDARLEVRFDVTDCLPTTRAALDDMFERARAIIDLDRLARVAQRELEIAIGEAEG